MASGSRNTDLILWILWIPMKIVSVCYFSATGRNPLNSPNKSPKDKPQDTIRYKGHRSLQLKSTEIPRKLNVTLLSSLKLGLP